MLSMISVYNPYSPGCVDHIAWHIDTIVFLRIPHRNLVSWFS